MLHEGTHSDVHRADLLTRAPASPRGPNGAAVVARRLRTTPGRLRALSILLILAIVALGAVGWIETTTRQNAARDIAGKTEPRLVDAEDLYVHLADADTTIATTFVNGGAEDPRSRRRYLGDLKLASEELASLTSQGGSPTGTTATARRAIRKLVQDLPSYSGLVEHARADNRAGYPLGASYLREASGLMGTSLLPSAEMLYAYEARSLYHEYRQGTSDGTLLACMIAAAIALLLVALTQVYVMRKTNRIFNVPLVAATVLIAVGLGLIVMSFVIEQNALARAARSSYRVEVLSAAMILTLRTQGDESLALVARGGGNDYLADFDAAAAIIDGSNGTTGLLKTAAQAGGHGNAGKLASDFGTYLSIHRKVLRQADRGEWACAVRLAVGSGAACPNLVPSPAPTSEVQAATLVDNAFRARIRAGQEDFERAARQASSALDWLQLAIAGLAAAAAVAAVTGLQRRIGEYR